jgi:hypothetical protein
LADAGLLGIEHVSIAPGITVVTPLNFESYPYSHSLDRADLLGRAGAVIYRFVRTSATERGGAHSSPASC